MVSQHRGSCAAVTDPFPGLWLSGGWGRSKIVDEEQSRSSGCASQGTAPRLVERGQPAFVNGTLHSAFSSTVSRLPGSPAVAGVTRHTKGLYTLAVHAVARPSRAFVFARRCGEGKTTTKQKAG